ncbi:MAG: NUDIX hydrolase [Candidatus Nanosyncoccaceae bacterium]|jgi:isopentenyldiphosphate isomerase
MPDKRILNIVDEQGNIIDEETREKIHTDGLLHREVHVWLYTPRGEIIFQHRGKNKDTYPDLLDASVGGHVEVGFDFEETALKELFEETGIKAKVDDLTLIQIKPHKSFDTTTNKINNVLRASYAYCYDGKIENLKTEDSEALGFETWSFEALQNISDKDKRRFITSVFKPAITEILAKIQKII